MSRSGAVSGKTGQCDVYLRRLTAIECVLVICASLVCDLNSSPRLVRVFEEVDIGTLVEPMMPGLLFGWTVEIVYVREASTSSVRFIAPICILLEQLTEQQHSPLLAGQPSLRALTAARGGRGTRGKMRVESSSLLSSPLALLWTA